MQQNSVYNRPSRTTLRPSPHTHPRIAVVPNHQNKVVLVAESVISSRVSWDELGLARVACEIQQLKFSDG